MYIWTEAGPSWTNHRFSVRGITELLKQISRDPSKGIGKPEPLRSDLAGFW
jgi:toxin YoeB